MRTKELLKLDFTLEQVRAELIRATTIHGPMRSAHEGYAVLKEEVDELWDCVKTKKRKHPEDQKKDLMHMREEAIQVAAMAIRFILDVTTVSNKEGVQLQKLADEENARMDAKLQEREERAAVKAHVLHQTEGGI